MGFMDMRRHSGSVSFFGLQPNTGEADVCVFAKDVKEVRRVQLNCNRFFFESGHLGI